MLPYVKVYSDFIEIVRALDNGARGRLFMAIMQYANDEEPNDLTGAEKIAFLTIKGQIDRDRASYSDVVAKRKAAGKAGASRRWGQENMANAILPIANDSKNSICHEDKDKEKDKDKDKDKEEYKRESREKSTQRFSPPTVEDVLSYCRETGKSIDAERFVDFYSSKGWRVGNTPMKDWKAAVRNWERREDGAPRQQQQQPDGVGRSKAKECDAKWGIVYSA